MIRVVRLGTPMFGKVTLGDIRLGERHTTVSEIAVTLAVNSLI